MRTFFIDTKDQLQAEVFVLSSCELDSESTLDQCRFAEALEGTQFGLGVRQLLLQLQPWLREGVVAVVQKVILEMCSYVFVTMCLASWLPADHHYLA